MRILLVREFFVRRLVLFLVDGRISFCVYAHMITIVFFRISLFT